MRKLITLTKNAVFQYIPVFYITFLIMFVLLRILFGIAIVYGESMLPTYKDTQIVFINRISEPSYGDVVIIKSEELNEDIIKRVIGLPGDTIEITDGVVSRNGVELKEQYINLSDPDTTTEFSVTVPAGTIFVMGDNRANSTDSRFLGCLDQNLIIGVVFGGNKQPDTQE